MNPPSWSEVATIGTRFLAFRTTSEELEHLGWRHLVWGLAWTWLVGIGRWWDDPGANWLQHLGLGSVAYVFVLALLLWLVMWPLHPHSWSYRRVLTLVCFTAPPAILYAIPLELWLGNHIAARFNLWFLLIVAVWRVALLVFFLLRAAP